jgi:glutamyl-tRNA reductase
MNIIVLGINHKTAPVEVREKYSFKEEELPDALQKLKSIEEVLECVIISTCNRVELYALMLTEDIEGLLDFLSWRARFKEHSLDQLRTLLYSHLNEKALEHICRVSSGLDSMVIGEPQIFGQMKDAYNIALRAGTTGPIFQSLFPQVFSLVKKIKSATNVGRNNVSVSYAAVSLARKIFKNIQGKSVMILGAGEMGELTVRNLMGQGVKRVYVSNRTFEKAVKVAETLRGIPIMLYELLEYLPRVDIIISSISAEDYVIKREEALKFQSLRNGKPLIIIDISVPRSIDPKIAGLENMYLYNIDDLKSVVESGLSLRIEEAQKANKLIEDKIQTILRQLKADDIEPTIAFLSNTAEEIRRQEYEKLVSSLNISEGEKCKIESFSRSLVGQIVHQSIVKMREYVNTMKFK